MMREFLWRIVARVVTHPAVFTRLLQRAWRTPYTHITSADGSDTYMARYWLFNPYPAPGQYRRLGWRDWLPSVRIHHIMRPDQDRHLHDHPWNARTIVLRGWYEEERPEDRANKGETCRYYGVAGEECVIREVFTRRAGYTGRLLFGQYHRISAVSEGGVWTMFWTWRKQGSWGFFVNGHKVPWREYLNAGNTQ